jgi:hypothetical protein
VLFPNQRQTNRFQIRKRRRNRFTEAGAQVRNGGIFIILLAAFSVVVLTASGATAPASYNAVLTWDRSPNSSVAGYRVHYGTASRNYTDSVVAGNVMTTTVGGLTSGSSYYFAVTAYDASGAQSDFSNEVRIVPGQPRVRLALSPAKQAVLTVSGLIGRTYDILASTNLTVWSVIGSATLGASATQDFTDVNAAGFPRRFYRTREAADPVNAAPAAAQVAILSLTPLRTLMTVTGLPGHTYELQVSQDLVNWIVLSRMTLDGSGMQFVVDRDTPYSGNRFYRAPHIGP